MPTPKLSRTMSDEDCVAIVALVAEHGDINNAARAVDHTWKWVNARLKVAAERGFAGTKPVIPGYAIKSVASKTNDGAWVKQVKEHGDVFEMPDGQRLKGVSALVDADGREVIKWVKTTADAEAQAAAMRAAVDGFKDELPRAAPVAAPHHTNADLLNQYTITDLHMGALAWHEETGSGDYDLSIAERLLDDWFAAAIHMAPPARVGVLAQIGDLLHYDSHESVTPASRHILDADSRFQKMVRAAIRVLRRVVALMLKKHEVVHIIVADANHDPASGAWLREMFAAFYDNEPRVTVDSSAGTYYVYRHGDVSLFVHHGHRRGVNNVDTVFAGKFREIYGATKFSYAHLGHRHSDELRTTNLMKVEQHETLAAPDAYAANGGWLSGRSAKVITYHAKHGEVGRLTLTPNMVAGAAGPINQEKAAA